jgi:hypothetical protein
MDARQDARETRADLEACADLETRADRRKEASQVGNVVSALAKGFGISQFLRRAMR